MLHAAFKYGFFKQAFGSFVAVRVAQSWLLVLAVLRMSGFGFLQHHIYLNVVDGRFQSCIVVVVGPSVSIVISRCFRHFSFSLALNNLSIIVRGGVCFSSREESLRLYVIDC